MGQKPEGLRHYSRIFDRQASNKEYIRVLAIARILLGINGHHEEV